MSRVVASGRVTSVVFGRIAHVTIYPHADPYQEAFWRGACAGLAAAFEGFADEFAANDPLNCDWRVDGCRQVASNMRAYGGAS